MESVVVVAAACCVAERDRSGLSSWELNCADWCRERPRDWFRWGWLELEGWLLRCLRESVRIGDPTTGKMNSLSLRGNWGGGLRIRCSCTLCSAPQPLRISSSSMLSKDSLWCFGLEGDWTASVATKPPPRPLLMAAVEGPGSREESCVLFARQLRVVVDSETSDTLRKSQYRPEVALIRSNCVQRNGLSCRLSVKASISSSMDRTRGEMGELLNSELYDWYWRSGLCDDRGDHEFMATGGRLVVGVCRRLRMFGVSCSKGGEPMKAVVWLPVIGVMGDARRLRMLSWGLERVWRSGECALKIGVDLLRPEVGLDSTKPFSPFLLSSRSFFFLFTVFLISAKAWQLNSDQVHPIGIKKCVFRSNKSKHSITWKCC